MYFSIWFSFLIRFTVEIQVIISNTMKSITHLRDKILEAPRRDKSKCLKMSNFANRCEFSVSLLFLFIFNFLYEKASELVKDKIAFSGFFSVTQMRV